ncbi:MAG: DUF4175 family protein [Bacteroidales bacterium]|jgi:hypothetical protein|nr:DUF4175 family protein [Bacteroidales bacterium]
MSSEIDILLKKLDDFIKRYYINEFLKGLILFLIISIFYFFSIFLIEYIAYLPSTIRTIIFYFSILLSGLTAIYYIIIPLFHIIKIGKIINYEQASHILSQHFPEIKDSLINTIQLAHNSSDTDNSIVIAAINQKISKLKPIPFSDAVRISTLHKQFVYAGLAIIFIISMYLIFPTIFSSGAERIIKHSENFEKPAPFTFILENSTTSVIKGEDYTVKLSIQGEYIPERVFFSIGNTKFIMKKTGSHSFEYTNKNCNNTFSFFFQADEHRSQEYTVFIKPKPQLLKFSLSAFPPAYTQTENFTIQNTGDITVPAGTRLEWEIKSSDTDSIFLWNKQDSSSISFTETADFFKTEYTIYKTAHYTLQGSNSFFTAYAIIDYTITSIPDERPSIRVQSQKDSTQLYTHYFRGKIQDDYGFTNLTFNWFETKNPDSVHSIPIQFYPNIPIQEFGFTHTFQSISENDSIKYFFEVRDNDQVYGAKATRTPISVFTLPSYEEQQKKMETLQSDMEKSLKESMSLNKEFIKDLEDLRKKLLQKDLSDWERSQIMDEMKEKQNQLEKSIEQVQESFQQKNELQKQLSAEEQNILEKNEQIQELLENLMDSELQKMFDELQNLMEEFNRDTFFEKSEELQMSMEELSKQLDRDLELLKQAEIEQKMKNTQKQLEKLAEEQQKLADQTKEKKSEQSDLQKKEEKISEDIKKVEEEYKDIQEKNEELQEKFSLPTYKEDFQEIQENIEKSMDELNKKQNKKSSGSMQESSEKMEKLAKKMQEMMDSQTAQQQMEDMNNLEQIIDNLLTFSHEQEKLIGETQTLSFRDPKYAETASKQNGLRENYNSIKDSIYNLSMRIPQISAPINKEMFEIHKNLQYALNHLEQRQRSGALVNQRYIMTSTNNVILLLSEILESMQQAQSQEGGSKQCPNQCNNPSSSGKGKPSMKNLEQMQQSLKQQMQQMLDQMKDGSQKQGQGAKQLSEMLSQQEMMKKMMNDLIKNGNISPEGTKQLQDIQKIMEQVERDIVNQQISQQTLFRQEQILTRLLESQKAENERDKDDKREGKEAENSYSETQKENLNTEKKNESEFIDILEQTNLQLRTYYKKIYSHYLLQINQN